MTIDALNNSFNKVYSSNSNEDKQAAKAQEAVQKMANKQVEDKLDLSPEAKNLKPIEANVMSGVYDRYEVLRKVAMRLTEELPPEEKTA